MATRANELAKLIGSTPSMSSRSSTYNSGDQGSGSIVSSVLVTIFILFIILLVVHYTVTPIFKFSIGDQGIIPLSNTNDGKLVWTKGPVASDISANVLPILPNSFTVQMDIFVDTQTTLSNNDRVFFYRSLRPVTPNLSATLLEQYPETNLLVHLKADTNDLVISALTLNDPNNLATATLESIPTILNVPVRQPFRITIVLVPQVLEVYLNGRLFGTKTFRYPLKGSMGYFFGPPNLFRTSVRVMNVQYWSRPLTSLEVRNAGPAISDISLFGAKLLCA